MRKLIPLASIWLTACASTPPPAPLPAWTKSPAREVENGYIVFVAEGDDHAADRAMTKAEGLGLQDLANECSLIPLGTRLEDRARTREGALNEAYAKVAVEFETCEEAKRARTPEAIRKIANVAMTEQLKRYQDLADEPTDVKPLVADQPAPAAPPSTGPGPAPVYGGISSSYQYYVVRQDVAYEKQAVVLAPPTAYAPGAPETTQFQHAMLRGDQAQAFALAHPAESTQTWSKFRGQAVRALRERRAGADHAMRAPRGVPTRAMPAARRGHGRRHSGR